MSGELDERLQRAKQRLRRRQKLQSQLAEAQSLLEEERARLRKHNRRLEEERADVQELEGLSLTGLFYTVLGSKEQQHERERQEFLEAKLKHEEASEAVEAVEQDVRRLREELAGLSDASKEYEQLIEEKEQSLAGADDGRAAQVAEFSEQLADLEADQQELEEAIEAGRSALESLESVRSVLQSAGNWGTWDMIGGGAISTAIKHSKIDEAKRAAQEAQRRLRLFREELAGAGARLHVSLDIGGLAKIGDYFFDGLITDWIVQSKIRDAQSACESGISQVRSILETCQKQLDETEQETKEVEQQRRRFIESA